MPVPLPGLIVRDFSRAVSGSPHARKSLWYPEYIPRAFVTIGSSIFSLKSSSENLQSHGYIFACLYSVGAALFEQTVKAFQISTFFNYD